MIYFEKQNFPNFQERNQIKTKKNIKREREKKQIEIFVLIVFLIAAFNLLLAAYVTLTFWRIFFFAYLR
jgi:hypothetical protein